MLTCSFTCGCFWFDLLVLSGSLRSPLSSRLMHCSLVSHSFLCRDLSFLIVSIVFCCYTVLVCWCEGIPVLCCPVVPFGILWFPGSVRTTCPDNVGAKLKTLRCGQQIPWGELRLQACLFRGAERAGASDQGTL